ncbi:MAG: hypothetical protein ACYC9Y_02010 [Candidatus Methylomirabilia bacterium]
MVKKRIGVVAALACAALVVAATAVAATDEVLRPYVLAAENPGLVADVVVQTRSALAQAGFEIAGEYPLSEAAHIIVITSDALRAAAAKTPDGGYGAALRVSVTQAGAAAQVVYTNPAWMANIYRLAAEPEGVAAALEKALGRREEFGSKSGFVAKRLRNYHYMMLMPYFEDQVELGTFASHADAVAKLEAGLAASAEAKSIYRIDVPGTEQSLFGIAILAGAGADVTVMKITDTGAPRHTAHLPYEVLVAGGRVLMLHGKFRIAQSFPDLTMGTFMKISGAPDGIAKVLGGLLK